MDDMFARLSAARRPADGRCRCAAAVAAIAGDALAWPARCEGTRPVRLRRRRAPDRAGRACARAPRLRLHARRRYDGAAARARARGDVGRSVGRHADPSRSTPDHLRADRSAGAACTRSRTQGSRVVCDGVQRGIPSFAVRDRMDERPRSAPSYDSARARSSRVRAASGSKWTRRPTRSSRPTRRSTICAPGASARRVLVPQAEGTTCRAVVGCRWPHGLDKAQAQRRSIRATCASGTTRAVTTTTCSSRTTTPRSA